MDFLLGSLRSVDIEPAKDSNKVHLHFHLLAGHLENRLERSVFGPLFCLI